MFFNIAIKVIYLSNNITVYSFNFYRKHCILYFIIVGLGYNALSKNALFTKLF